MVIIHYLHEIFQRKKQHLPKREREEEREMFDLKPGKRETRSPAHSVDGCANDVISSKLGISV